MILVASQANNLAAVFWTQIQLQPEFYLLTWLCKGNHASVSCSSLADVPLCTDYKIRHTKRHRVGSSPEEKNGGVIVCRSTVFPRQSWV